MIRHLAGTFLFIAATAALTAQVFPPSPPAYGSGATTTCAQWLAATKGGAPDPMLLSWAVGYLSGAVANGAPLGPDAGKNAPANIDSFCKTNANLPISAAVEAVVKQARIVNHKYQ
ncbi:MAG: hypothetical protein ABI051_03540 [Vicinamibacterales bacterium]